MAPQHSHRTKWTLRPIVYFCAVCICLAIAGAAVVARAGGTSAAPAWGSYLSSLPASKQSIVNRMNAARAAANPHPPAPNPSAARAIVVQPCTRDLSLLATGMTRPHSQGDIPNGQEFTFNNEWTDPHGTQSVMAGNVTGTSQGVITGATPFSGWVGACRTRTQTGSPSRTSSRTRS
jgi:hypothetical protein